VPARKSTTPGRLPLLLALHALGGELPDREVRGIALLRDLLDTPAFALAGQGQAREVCVGGKAARVVVDPVAGAIGEALLLEAQRQGDLLLDVLCGLAQNLGIEAAQSPAVLDPLFRVLGRNIGRLATGPGGGLLHLVFARIGIVGEVTDVGDVDDVGHAIVGLEQGALENVGEEIRAQVPQVLGRIHRGAAAVDPHVARLDGLEALFAAASCVVEDDSAQRSPLPSCVVLDCSNTTARLAMPSPRPRAPRWSVLVIFRLMRPGSASRSFASTLRISSW